LPGLGYGKVFEPVREDADHVGEGCDAAFKHMHALLEGRH
jgi:hypothetical protein